MSSKQGNSKLSSAKSNDTVEIPQSVSRTAELVKSFVNTAKTKPEAYATSLKLKGLVESLFGRGVAEEGPVTIVIAIVTNLVFQRRLDSDGKKETTDSFTSDLARVGSTVLSLLPQIFLSIGEGSFSSFAVAIGIPSDFERSVDKGIEIGLQAAKLSNAITEENAAVLTDQIPIFTIKNASMAILYASYTLAGTRAISSDRA